MLGIVFRRNDPDHRPGEHVEFNLTSGFQFSSTERATIDGQCAIVECNGAAIFGFSDVGMETIHRLLVVKIERMPFLLKSTTFETLVFGLSLAGLALPPPPLPPPSPPPSVQRPPSSRGSLGSKPRLI
jgi:hypothetical protein